MHPLSHVVQPHFDIVWAASQWHISKIRSIQNLVQCACRPMIPEIFFPLSNHVPLLLAPSLRKGHSLCVEGGRHQRDIIYQYIDDRKVMNNSQGCQKRISCSSLRDAKVMAYELGLVRLCSGSTGIHGGALGSGGKRYLLTFSD